MEKQNITLSLPKEILKKANGRDWGRTKLTA